MVGKGSAFALQKWFSLCFHWCTAMRRLRHAAFGNTCWLSEKTKHLRWWNVFDDMCRMMGWWSFWSWFDANRSTFEDMRETLLFSRPYLVYGRAIATLLRLSSVVRPSSVTLCIVAKRCVLEQKLLLRAYRKSYNILRNRLVPKWMTLTFV